MAQKIRQPILTDEEITEIIINYIDNNIYNYAIMIDGDWGCGKTYFVKENLIGSIDRHEKSKEEAEKRQVVYISLYGVDSVDDISKQIIVNSYLEKTGKAKGFLQTGAKLLKVIGTFKDVDAEGISGKLIELLPVKNSIFIFDDLERCDCPVNEILGYINSFVEQEGIKVIIVANEKEIGSNTFQTNQELKYLVAAHAGINFDRDDKKNWVSKPIQTTKRQTQGENQQPVQISINTLKKRIEDLFGQDEIYARVKEKLVGNTIHYFPNLKGIFESIINRVAINGELRGLLQEKLPFFEEYMISEDHPNLRTFQFFLLKIQDLYAVVSKLEGIGQQSFLKYIVQYCFKICVSYKSGAYEYNWAGNAEYGFMPIGRVDIWGSDLNLRFVDDFIIGSILDSDRAEKMLGIFEKEYIKKRNEELDLLRKLELNWYISTDTEIEKMVKEIIKALGEDKYDPNDYTRIINILLHLEEIGFSEENVPDAISKMKSNIEKQTQHIYLDRGFSLDASSKYKERHASIMDELQAEADKKAQEQAIDSIAHFLFAGDSWAENLYDYVQKNYRAIANETGFLERLNIDELVAKLSNSKSFDLYAFRLCILQLYSAVPIKPALQHDKLRLMALKEKIEELDQHPLDRIQRTHFKFLIQDLNKAIALYRQDEQEIIMGTE